MSECVLESQEGSNEREALYSMLRENGSKTNPILTQFCQLHGVPHIVETPEDLSGRRMIEVPKEALEPIKYSARPYCSSCASYHSGPCNNPGRAVKLGTEQWEKKGAGI